MHQRFATSLSGRPDPVEEKRQPRLPFAVGHVDAGSRLVLLPREPAAVSPSA